MWSRSFLEYVVAQGEVNMCLFWQYPFLKTLFHIKHHQILTFPYDDSQIDGYHWK